MCPIEDKSHSGKPDQTDNNNMGPKVADWRFGPAQVWYDMLEVPETGEGFNYGFKIKEKVTTVSIRQSTFSYFTSVLKYCLFYFQTDEEEQQITHSYPDDAFLMVSQLHWEDEVVWNGDEIKHKVS